MPVTVIVGGQFGSEGKGKVAHYFAKEMGASVVVRCGGPNSGHTVIDGDKPVCFKHLPTAALLPDVTCVLCAGTYIDVFTLMAEIEKTKIGPNRLLIDPKAVIVTNVLKYMEQEGKLIDAIGSTGSGTGEAVIQRIKRRPMYFAEGMPILVPYLEDTKGFLRGRLNREERVIIEGTQGFGLSLLHSPHYPYVTSRDTTAAGFLSEAGLSPFDVDDIVMVIRAFPIRVAGNSGPLQNEITWDIVTQESGQDRHIQEITSVTKKIRRVARFDPDIVNLAIEANRPTKIVLNHLDYLHPDKVREFISDVQGSIGRRINYLGYGPDVIDVTKCNY